MGEEVDPLLGCGEEEDFAGLEELLEKEVLQIGIRCGIVNLPPDEGKDLEDEFELLEGDGVPGGEEEVAGLVHREKGLGVGLDDR